jgi:hypothetical protein
MEMNRQDGPEPNSLPEKPRQFLELPTEASSAGRVLMINVGYANKMYV